jgi:hypothetical protein
VRCWGDNATGALGDGSGATQLAPVAVAGIASADVIEAGEGHACAGLADGTVWCWGANDVGQLGTGTSVPSGVPIEVRFPEPAGDVSITSGPGSAVTAESPCAAGDVLTFELGWPRDESRTVCRVRTTDGPTQTYSSDSHWRCTSTRCPAPVPYDGANVDATEFFVARCVPR